MSVREFSLEAPVDIGGGFMATGVWVSGGPIVLIRAFNKRQGVEINSRLDLQKRVFIDDVPGERREDGISNLVSSVVLATRDARPSGHGLFVA